MPVSPPKHGPKTHYAQKAARRFLIGTNFSSPDEAIAAGFRTEDQWTAFMQGQMKQFWSLNGQKARRKVRGRYPMKRVKGRPKHAENRQIDQKKRRADVLALEKRAHELGEIGGKTATRIDRQSRAAYSLYLDFCRHAMLGEFAAWLARHSGLPRTTCQARLLAGTALALGLSSNQSGLLAEMQERRTTVSVETGGGA